MQNKDWKTISNELFENLHNRNVLKDLPEAKLKFSVQPSDCRIAWYLQDAVNWLIDQVKPVWLTVILYDPFADDPEKVHNSHINFNVNLNLESTFNENKNKMFLLTGICCGLAGYIPQKSNEETLQKLDRFSNFAILKRNQKSNCELKNTIILHESVYEHDDYVFSCSDTNDLRLRYISEAIEARCQNSDCVTLFQNTIDIFRNNYPSVISNNDEWLSLFIPAVHIPKTPFAKNGLLISFDNIIDQGKFEILKKWTYSVCGQITASLLVESRTFWNGPWRGLGSGQDLKKYLECFEFRKHPSNKNKIEKKLKILKDKSLLNLLSGCVPPDHELSALKKENIDDTTRDRANQLSEFFPNWSQKFSIYFDYELSPIAFLICLMRQIKHEELHLVSMIAFSEESGWEVVNKIEKEFSKTLLLSNQLCWKLGQSNFSPEVILKNLVYISKIDFIHARQYIAYDKLKNNIQWILDIKFEDLQRGKLEETKLYLELLEQSLQQESYEFDVHLLTWKILAASALANGNLFIILNTLVQNYALSVQGFSCYTFLELDIVQNLTVRKSRLSNILKFGIG